MFNTAQVRSSYNSVLNSVRDSGLNFSCNETPFSITFTVRKSMHGRSAPESQPAPAEHGLKELKQLNEGLRNTEITLSKALETTKKELTATLSDLEEQRRLNSGFNRVLKDLNDTKMDLKNATTNLNNYKSANEILTNQLQEASFAYEKVQTDHQDALEHAHNVALDKEECQRVIKNLHEKLDRSEKFVKEGRDSLGKLSDSNKKLTDAIKSHKENEKDLKSRLKAATESLAVKAQSQPQGLPFNRTEQIAENLAVQAQIQPAKPTEDIAHFDHEITNLPDLATTLNPQSPLEIIEDVLKVIKTPIQYPEFLCDRW